MFMLLVAIIVAAVLVVVLFRYSCSGYQGRHTVAGIAGVVLALGTGVTAVVYAVAGLDYIAADYKADIINREFHTNYTQAEVFFASDVIDTIRELDRKRIELNGSLMQWDQESGDDQQNR